MTKAEEKKLEKAAERLIKKMKIKEEEIELIFWKEIKNEK